MGVGIRTELGKEMRTGIKIGIEIRIRMIKIETEIYLYLFITYLSILHVEMYLHNMLV